MSGPETGSAVGGSGDGAGPFHSERDASHSPAARAVWDAFNRDPGPGRMLPLNLLMLTDACESAGVELGAYDEAILGWLANYEPATCSVVAGLITRAAAGSKVNPELPGGQSPVDLKTTDRRQADGRQAR